MVYIFLMFFVLINIFLAILNDAYAKTKEQMDEREAEAAAAKEAAKEEGGEAEATPGLVARGRARIERFKHRVKSLNRRRKEEAPQGASDWREVGY